MFSRGTGLMRWEDEGIFLTGRPHGETSVIADVFTRQHGRSLGLVKGGRSRRLRPLLQAGNILHVDWRARLDDQLGVLTAELTAATASAVFDDAVALAGVASLCALLQQLPERDPHTVLFDEARACLARPASGDFPATLAKFELIFLNELGFGLDLTSCAVTGREDDLTFVSPRSARAVSREAGLPYRDRLLPLPSFLVSKSADAAELASTRDVIDAFALTGYFLKAGVFDESGSSLPPSRDTFLRYLAHAKHKDGQSF